ncbi:hypothetical protein F0562_030375 [Nyssa sinensis]|uniref:NmrA-like domain-containing protein n=1 Tax=Nyssa sinensis TaxID=561372 RepID=A0A5J5B0C9_9ASTE|nr:hypothetical protein F0562_030375 [Nyssa sinensis]
MGNIRMMMRLQSLLCKVYVIYNDDGDIATYTIKAVDDPITLNKVLHFRLPKNIYTVNELVSLWEKKSGKTLERTYVLEEQLLKDIQVK